MPFFFFSWLQMYGASEATSPGFPWQHLRGTRCLSSTVCELKASEPLSDQQSPPSNLGLSTQLKSAPSHSFSSSQTSCLVIQNSGKMLGGYYLWKQLGQDRTRLFPVVHLHSSRVYGHNQSIFCTDRGLTAVCCVNTHLSSKAGVAGRWSSLEATTIREQPGDSGAHWWHSAPACPRPLAGLSPAEDTADFTRHASTQLPSWLGPKGACEAFLTFQGHFLHSSGPAYQSWMSSASCFPHLDKKPQVCPLFLHKALPGEQLDTQVSSFYC